MPLFVKKKVYTIKYIREIRIELQAAALVAQITIIMIILVVSITMKIQSIILVSQVRQTTMQIQSLM